METVFLEAGRWSVRASDLAAEGWLCMSLCGVDRLGIRDAGWGAEGEEVAESRFEIVVHLIHHADKRRMRVHVSSEGDPPTIPSVTSVWPTVDFMEREVFDMFGIEFSGHPDLTRILMPEEWEGFPLRKDYGVGKVTVEFVPQPFLQVEAPGQSPAHGEAEESVDEWGQIAGSARHRGDESGRGAAGD